MIFPKPSRNRLCFHGIFWCRKPTPRIKQCVASYQLPYKHSTVPNRPH